MNISQALGVYNMELLHEYMLCIATERSMDTVACDKELKLTLLIPGQFQLEENAEQQMHEMPYNQLRTKTVVRLIPICWELPHRLLPPCSMAQCASDNSR